MVNPIDTLDGARPMAQDVRPFRTGAAALFVLAALLFGLGLWGQINVGASDPATRLVTGVAEPFLRAAVPDALGEPQTIFGTFAKIGGAAALAGLLLLTVQSRAAQTAPEPVPAAAQRITPRRPGDLRAARSAQSATITTASEPAPLPEEATPDAEVANARKAGQRFHRGALMLIGSAMIGIGGFWMFGRDGFAFPSLPTFGISSTAAALSLLAASVCAFAMLAILRRRAAAKKAVA